MKLLDLRNLEDDTNLNKKYLAFLLDEESSKFLINKFNPKFSKIFSHHVTIEFNLTSKKIDEIIKSLNDPILVKVIAYYYGDGVDCIEVSIDGKNFRLDGSKYHVTLSTEPPVKPVKSNDILKRESNKELVKDSIYLTGSLKLLNK